MPYVIGRVNSIWKLAAEMIVLPKYGHRDRL